MAGSVWKNSQERFSTFSRRERILFLFTVTVAMIAGWHHFFWKPFSRSQANVEKRLARLARNHQAAQNVGSLDQVRVPLVGSWVPPGEMNKMVDLLMNTQGRLRLVDLEAKPAHLLLHCEAGLGHDGPGSLFRHDLEFLLEGNYPNILNYLYAVENTPWKIKMDYFKLKVAHPPQASVRLRVHFNSLSRSLFADGPSR